jgi:hypothetical protein
MSDLATQGNTPFILAIEAAMKANFDQAALKELTDTQHYRIPGVYARTMFVPAGMAITGKIHNFESIGILAQGTMRITNGETSVIVSAPHISVDKPGIKRFGYAETDCTFISVHRTDAETIDAIEDELVSDTFEEFEIKRLGRDL